MGFYSSRPRQIYKKGFHQYQTLDRLETILREREYKPRVKVLTLVLLAEKRYNTRD